MVHSFTLTCFPCLKLSLMSGCASSHSASMMMEVTYEEWQRGMIKGVWSLTASWSFYTCLDCLTLHFLLLEKNDTSFVTSLLSVSCFMHLDTILTNTLLCPLLNSLNFYYDTHHTEFSLLTYMGISSTLQ